MATEDTGRGVDTDPIQAGSAIPGLKALLKESLAEILRETPSLLQLSDESQRGKLPTRALAREVRR